jgi:DHA2 family multidrug resistance protein
MCVSVDCLKNVLEEGQFKDWLESTEIRVTSALAVVALAMFVVRELTAAAPAVNLRLFRNRTSLAGTAIGGLQFAMLMGSMFMLPVFMQELQGMSATEAGIALIPRTVVMMLVMPFIGRLYNKVPPALMVAVGIVLFAVGSLEFSHLTLATSTWQLLWPMAVTGIGFAFLFVALTTAALSDVPRPLLADAAGLSSFVRQLGGSIGLALFATLLSRYAVQARSGLLPAVSYTRPSVAHFLHLAGAGLAAHGFPAREAQAAAVAAPAGRVRVQATVLAFEKAFLLQGLAFLTALPLLYFLRVRRGPAGSVQPTEV